MELPINIISIILCIYRRMPNAPEKFPFQICLCAVDTKCGNKMHFKLRPTEWEWIFVVVCVCISHFTRSLRNSSRNVIKRFQHARRSCNISHTSCCRHQHKYPAHSHTHRTCNPSHGDVDNMCEVWVIRYNVPNGFQFCIFFLLSKCHVRRKCVV